MTTVDTTISIESSTTVVMQPPSKFNVVLYNDNQTTMEFVVLVLMSIFHKTIEEATALTLNIHETGKGIAGSYGFEIASQKRDETVLVARTNNYPLKCQLEETT